ncbi:protein kinase [Penicillium concentricum]|uniref:Protein kinase n=1 Tax=Penicillium concentricum TaxID=293559 RepID=A0A9W9VI71_9EURO|nr:protein kinase [Penicillium concentricum]KAJ5383183.1 protein kinase [Penicillium concentricum]
MFEINLLMHRIIAPGDMLHSKSSLILRPWDSNLVTSLTYIDAWRKVRNATKGAIVSERCWTVLKLIELLASTYVLCILLYGYQCCNITIGIEDDSVFTEFEETEMQNPRPRKVVGPDGRTIYLSQDLRMPKRIGHPVLCDFGSAVPGDIEHSEDIQPNLYRAPEVILAAPWTYSVDIWNVECMIWDIFEGGHLFTGHDPEFETYRSRAHLANMINLFLVLRLPAFLNKGQPAADSLLRNVASYEYTDEFRAKDLLRNHVPLEERETTLDGQDKVEFVRLMRKMLQWEPAKRSSANELAEDEWLRRHL